MIITLEAPEQMRTQAVRACDTVRGGVPLVESSKVAQSPSIIWPQPALTQDSGQVGVARSMRQLTVHIGWR